MGVRRRLFSVVERDGSDRTGAFAGGVAAGAGGAWHGRVGGLPRILEDSGDALSRRAARICQFDNFCRARFGAEFRTLVRWHTGGALWVAAVFCWARFGLLALACALAQLDAVGRPSESRRNTQWSRNVGDRAATLSLGHLH